MFSKSLLALLLSAPLLASAGEMSCAHSAVGCTPDTAKTVKNPESQFNTDKFIACDAHSLIVVQLAQKAAREKRPVEQLLSESYASPKEIDIKLARIGQDAIKAGALKAAGERSLQRFLTGICYGSTD